MVSPDPTPELSCIKEFLSNGDEGLLGRCLFFAPQRLGKFSGNTQWVFSETSNLWDGGLQVVVFIQELQQLLGGSVNGQLVWFNSLLLQGTRDSG